MRKINIGNGENASKSRQDASKFNFELLIILAILAVIFLCNSAHAGTNFTGIGKTISYVDISKDTEENKWEELSSLIDTNPMKSSSALIKDWVLNFTETNRRRLLIKKINEIQSQFEEAERASQKGLSKERIKELEKEAIKVLTGATVFTGSMVVK
jgi:hypothetical protein